MSNFMKICPVGTELFHADGRMDGQTHMKTPVVTFINFASAPQRPFKSLSIPTYDKFLGLRPIKYTKWIDWILEFFQRNSEEERQPMIAPL